MEKRLNPPWHFWFISMVSLIWNSFSAMDLFMTQTRNSEYMAQFSKPQLDFFYSFPLWVNATWIIAVTMAVLGSILLLLRSRFAVPAFWIALIAMIATAFHNFLLSDVTMAQIAGTPAIIFTVVIFLISCTLIWYAKRASNLNYLR